MRRFKTPRRGGAACEVITGRERGTCTELSLPFGRSGRRARLSAMAALTLGVLVLLGSIGVAQSSAYVYWASTLGGTIGRASLNGTGVNEGFITGADQPQGVALDGVGANADHVYWTNNASGTIGRANLNGTGVNQNFITGAKGPAGIAVEGGYIYWANAGGDTIGRAKLNGTEVDQSFITGVYTPVGVATTTYSLFWTELGRDTIADASLAGSEVNHNFIVDAEGPEAVAILAVLEKELQIFWSNSASNTIGKAGPGINQSFITGADGASGVAVDTEYVYWGNYSDNTVGRATINGSEVNQSFITAHDPAGLALDSLEPLEAVTEGAHPVTETTATLNGAVQLKNGPGFEVSECKFEYGTTTSYGSSATCSSLPGSGFGLFQVSASLTGLTANTTYHYRIVATEPSSTGYGSDATFKTLPNPPVVTTSAASSIAQSTASLNARVNPNGGEVSQCEFEYGTTTSYGSSAPCSSPPGSGSYPVAVAASLTGLAANTTYHYRVLADNAGGSSYGSDLSFKTLPDPLVVATSAASSVTQSTATLNATVNPDGGEVSECRFEFGTGASYGSAAPCSSLPGSGTSPVAVSAQITHLEANITYHFRIRATSAGGTGYGVDQTFTTLALATLTGEVGVLGPQEPKVPPVPDAELASASLTASSSGIVAVKVTCPAAEISCTGTLTLRTLKAVIAATGHQSRRSKAMILTLAVGSFKAAGGHTTTVKLRLSAKARTLLARERVLRARATIAAHDPAGAKHTAQTLVTIRPAKARRKS